MRQKDKGSNPEESLPHLWLFPSLTLCIWAASGEAQSEEERAEDEEEKSADESLKTFQCNKITILLCVLLIFV